MGTFDPTLSTEGYIKLPFLQGIITAAEGKSE